MHATAYRPHDPFDRSALLRDLSGLDFSVAAADCERAAADYHGYSPVLLERLRGKRPHGVLRPRDTDEVQLADPLGLMNPGKVRGWDEQVLGIAGGRLFHMRFTRLRRA